MTSTPEHHRSALLARALTLSYLSIGWGVVSGVVSVGVGLRSGSLGVLGLGLNVLADLVGSLGLVWRFRLERQRPHYATRAEAHVSILVASTLGVVATSLGVAAIAELVSGSMPHSSVLALVSAGASVMILSPLGTAKRRTGQRLHSHALVGDGTLSLIGAVLGMAALSGLLANRLFGWGWADRVVALAMAMVAAVEMSRVLRERSRIER